MLGLGRLQLGLALGPSHLLLAGNDIVVEVCALASALQLLAAK